MHISSNECYNSEIEEYEDPSILSDDDFTTTYYRYKKRVSKYRIRLKKLDFKKDFCTYIEYLDKMLYYEKMVELFFEELKKRELKLPGIFPRYETYKKIKNEIVLTKLKKDDAEQYLDPYMEIIRVKNYPKYFEMLKNLENKFFILDNLNVDRRKIVIRCIKK